MELLVPTSIVADCDWELSIIVFFALNRFCRWFVIAIGTLIHLLRNNIFHILTKVALFFEEISDIANLFCVHRIERLGYCSSVFRTAHYALIVQIDYLSVFSIEWKTIRNDWSNLCLECSSRSWWHGVVQPVFVNQVPIERLYKAITNLHGNVSHCGIVNVSCVKTAALKVRT